MKAHWGRSEAIRKFPKPWAHIRSCALVFYSNGRRRHGSGVVPQPARCDYECERNGTANLFMMFAPLEGWRRIKVTDRRTAVDYARALEVYKFLFDLMDGGTGGLMFMPPVER